MIWKRRRQYLRICQLDKMGMKMKLITASTWMRLHPAIFSIPQNRTAQMRHMGTQLVGSACHRLKSNKAYPVKGCQPPKMGDAWQTGLINHHFLLILNPLFLQRRRYNA